MAVPFMKASRGSAHAFHGMGREDIDARCLAWRPFVLEIVKPKIRRMDLRKLARKIGKGVSVRGIRFSSIAEVRRIKEAKADKTYRCIVECSDAVSRKDLKKLSSLITTIYQKTPQRVLHRRADIGRKRRVKAISSGYRGPKRFVFTVKGEGGLYIKELVTGDGGRTRPSVSEILGMQCTPKYLDVIKIHAPNKSVS